jgi:hypothetical protein
MTAYPNLTDSEITSIYDFIQNESEKKNYKFDDSYCFGKESLENALNLSKRRALEEQIDGVDGVSSLQIDRFLANDSIPVYNFIGSNTFTIKDFKWHNCDSPIENCEDVELAVDYDKSKIEGIDFYLIYKNRNILYHWYFTETVKIPTEDVTIIAFAQSKKGFEFYKKDLKVEKKNKWYLDFKPKTNEEIQAELAKL